MHFNEGHEKNENELTLSEDGDYNLTSSPVLVAPSG